MKKKYFAMYKVGLSKFSLVNLINKSDHILTGVVFFYRGSISIPPSLIISKLKQRLMILPIDFITTLSRSDLQVSTVTCIAYLSGGYNWSISEGL